MLPTIGAAMVLPVHKSTTFTLTPLFNPMSPQTAVIVFVPLPMFSMSTTTSPLESGPAHTCSGIDESTAGGGGGGGGAVLGLLARHQGVFEGKFLQCCDTIYVWGSKEKHEHDRDILLDHKTVRLYED
jgi:hypothetical protein